MLRIKEKLMNIQDGTATFAVRTKVSKEKVSTIGVPDMHSSKRVYLTKNDITWSVNSGMPNRKYGQITCPFDGVAYLTIYCSNLSTPISVGLECGVHNVQNGNTSVWHTIQTFINKGEQLVVYIDSFNDVNIQEFVLIPMKDI